MRKILGLMFICLLITGCSGEKENAVNLINSYIIEETTLDKTEKSGDYIFYEYLGNKCKYTTFTKDDRLVGFQSMSNDSLNGEYCKSIVFDVLKDEFFLGDKIDDLNNLINISVDGKIDNAKIGVYTIRVQDLYADFSNEDME